METVNQTLDSGLEMVFRKQKNKISDLRKEPLSARLQRLKNLRHWIHTNRIRIHEAMYADFRKHPTEVDGIELFHVLAEIKNALANLELWAAPKKVDAPFTMLGTRSYIQFEPRGVCLILAPWNYPFSLCAGPLVLNTQLLKQTITSFSSHLLRKAACCLRRQIR